MLACLKFSNPGNGMWTKNFLMFKLDLEKTEEPEIKLPTSTGSYKKQESSEKTPTFFSLTTPKPLTVWITTNWKILQEMGIPDHLTCLLRHLYAGQEATVRTGHGTMDWFQIWKGVCQGCVVSPWLFNLYAAAAAAKSPQSCLTLCDPIDSSPPGCPIPGFLQAKTLEWVAISFSSAWKWKVKVKSSSRVRLLAAPWTAAYQAPPSMQFSRHNLYAEYISKMLGWMKHKLESRLPG